MPKKRKSRQRPSAAPRPAPESDGATSSSPGRLAGLVSRPAAWLAGVAAATLVAVLTAWVPQHGRDTLAAWTGAPALRIMPVRTSADDYALPGEVTEAADRAVLLDSSASSSKLPDLLRRHAAAAVGQIKVRLVLEGDRNSLRVTDLKVRIRKVTGVLSGTYLGVVNAGEDDSIQMSATLDAADPVLRLPDAPHDPYFSRKQIDLARGERETLDITLTANRNTYEFDFVATVVSDGESYEQVIDGAGQLLRVTGKLPDYHRYGTVLVADVGEGYRSADTPTLCSFFDRSEGC
ncbi:hypothetical protein [Actinoplanes sp. NPDC049802]|uniref:hypothetical protein n=1 Tax=Actinoplanes sp. NPDC049802 TaxID=3154742 RepID=UPI0033F9D9FF